jgi:ABC-type polysaccharide/polyol phosphate export permease
MLLSLIPYTIILYVRGLAFPSVVFFFPIVVIAFAMFLAGVSLTLSTLNVFFRDVAHVLGPVLSLVFYATPVIYDRNNPTLPEYVRKLLSLNPFSHFIECFRSAIYSAEIDIAGRLPVLFGLGVLSLAFGFFVYRRAKTKILFRL